MEAKLRDVLITAIAPIAWGSTYVVTAQLLPADLPLWGAALRAAPAAVFLLLLSRRRPHGAWWWRAALLGVINVVAFFILIYLAAHHLPSSVASVIMAASPLAMVGAAWLLASESPSARVILGAAVGMIGVPLVVGFAHGGDLIGLCASISAMIISAIGFALTKRWSGQVRVIDATAWQFAFGGAALVVVAILGEGTPPVFSTSELLGFTHVAVIATAAAFVCWFHGLAVLPAGVVGVIGLLNPVTGVLLGALIADESLTVGQLVGITIVGIGVLIGQHRPRRVGAAPPTASTCIPGGER